eukprot:jgi/Bigna1/70752/fgenesh1_pg.13_\
MLSSAVHTLVAAIIWSSGDIFTANAGNFVSRRPACRSGLGDTATRLRTNAMMARVQRRVAPTNDDLHSERHQPHQTDMSKRRRKSLQSLLFGLPASAVLAFSTLNNAKPAFASTLTEDRGEEEASAGDESVADSFTVDQIIETIKDDIVEHQYLITGDLNDVIYTPNNECFYCYLYLDRECEFKQPLQTIKGTAEYKKRIGKLWDQSKSSVELLEWNLYKFFGEMTVGMLATHELRVIYYPKDVSLQLFFIPKRSIRGFVELKLPGDTRLNHSTYTI